MYKTREWMEICKGSTSTLVQSFKLTFADLQETGLASVICKIADPHTVFANWQDSDNRQDPSAARAVFMRQSYRTFSWAQSFLLLLEVWTPKDQPMQPEPTPVSGTYPPLKSYTPMRLFVSRTVSL